MRPNQIVIRVIVACLILAAAYSLGCASQTLPVSLPTENSAALARKYQIKRVGSLDVAPLYFEGVRLFDITAPAGRDPNAYPPVAARLDVIHDHLSDVVPAPASLTDIFQPPPARYDPATFEVKIGQRNGYVTLSASDRSGAPEIPLLTLTDQDAKYNGVAEGVLARQWADTLQSVLVEALEQRHPLSAGDIIRTIFLIVAIVVIASLVLLVLKTLVKRQIRVLEDRLALSDEASAEGEGLAALRSRLRIARSALVVIDWVLTWALVVVWALALLASLRALPAGQGVARQLSAKAISIAAIWLLAAIADAVGRVLVARAAKAWQERPTLTLDEAGRRELRLPTVVRSLEYGKTMAVYAIAVVLTLGTIGASTSAVVTLGAALAFAISFGAQSLVKDLVNGFFILVEDQYAMGDYVGIGTVAGIIEAVTLRFTQLRTDDGRLVTIPNSQVAVVENWTRGWSRADYRLAVALDSDVPDALKVFEGVLFDLAAEPQWHRIIPQPPRVLGVETMASTGIVLRAWVQTTPGQMFAVTREINRRMLAAMHDSGITIALPMTRTFSSSPPVLTPHEQPAPATPEATASPSGASTGDRTTQRNGESAPQDGTQGATPSGERSAGEPM